MNNVWTVLVGVTLIFGGFVAGKGVYEPEDARHKMVDPSKWHCLHNATNAPLWVVGRGETVTPPHKLGPDKFLCTPHDMELAVVGGDL